MVRRAAIVIGLLALCTAGHFLTPRGDRPMHEFLFKATYVPIVLAGLWFGVKGGLATSVATSLLYVFHVEHQLGGQFLGGNIGPTLDIMLYNGIALLTGVLSERQLRARRRAEGLARERANLHAELAASYQALRQRTGELLHTEEELRAADRLVTLGDMAASLAHEIRNPLSGLSNAALVLCRDSVDKKTREEFRAIIEKETDQLNRVVHDFLGLASAQHSQSREIDLGEFLHHAADSVSDAARQQSIEVEVRLEKPERVQTIPVLLERVLLSLVRNAVEAIRDGGTVTLSGEVRGEEMVLSVRDTGEGIPAEAMERLFEPFYTTKQGGVGLGLFFARRIARGLGGDITAASQVGEGTEFLVRIPLGASVTPRER